ncbi:Alkaline phosphatase D-related protein [Metarhizium guizhouense ARSEF 977]|uniref:Alkaline phosphatase D-related protein n=1 Tax=Metarhizium guizhouense (strain ARSEF 977) TaxID=1276136 RepID=A0A0B4GZ96_METGA|nr:Alkaline phosphatase D-related protein [Metarhizium guizhouense ARSEF 977]
MASQRSADAQYDDDTEHNPHASASRWRHQESSAYRRHAGNAHGQARDPVSTETTTGDLATFLNASRVEPTGDTNGGGNFQPITVAAVQSSDREEGGGGGGSSTPPPDGKEIVCGPLLNYRRMEQDRWYGSVLIVATGGGKDILYQPSLVLRRADEAAARQPDTTSAAGETQFQAQRLYSDPRNTFWAFEIDVPIEAREVRYEYEIPDVRYSRDHKPRVNNFFVPAADESMRVMFHSCNGFSVGTDEEAFSGAPLWRDVMRKHERAPFHVMLGGGDQIYNDGIRVNGPLRPWTDIRNPKKRSEFPFPEKLRAECDDYYLKNYIRWYNSAPFALANGQIPQVNIWDDHDIIDGFGSYVDSFMRCDVFRGIGGTAHKYYLLFQHHLPPPLSTYTSDHLDANGDSPGPDPNQLVNTFVADPKLGAQYIRGTKPGPYVAEHSLSLYTRLGARMAMLGIDARTERTRHQVNYPETYEIIFERLRRELSEAVSSGRPIKHLILLLGIPIAYPRLTWLENILRSPIIGPIKFLHRRFGVGGGLFNQFDGSVDLLDDLDDHYTAKTHKVERRDLVEGFQQVAAEFSVRVTILGGDVHLAALGRFYSNPKLKLAAEKDNRYMANIVSSAIVNKPPPHAVANLLARRNKIHHLNGQTDETLLDLFDKDPGESNKTADHNHCTMPSRNYAMLTENSPNNVTRGTNGEVSADGEAPEAQSFIGKDGHSEIHQGEIHAGTKHKSASDAHGRGSDGSLDIRINVEIDQHSAEGQTQAYGLSVPLLHYEKPATPGSRPMTGQSTQAVA